MGLLFKKFVATFEDISGSEATVPNIHSCFHVERLVRLFGPICQYWCFAAERMIEVLKRVWTNQRLPEVQIMRAVEQEQQVLDLASRNSYSGKIGEFFHELSESFTDEDQPVVMRFSPESLLQHMAFIRSNESAKGFEPFPGRLCGPLHDHTLDQPDHTAFLKALELYYPGTQPQASPLVAATSHLEFLGTTLGVADSTENRSYYVYSRFSDSKGKCYR